MWKPLGSNFWGLASTSELRVWGLGFMGFLGSTLCSVPSLLQLPHSQAVLNSKLHIYREASKESIISAVYGFYSALEAWNKNTRNTCATESVCTGFFDGVSLTIAKPEIVRSPYPSAYRFPVSLSLSPSLPPSLSLSLSLVEASSTLSALFCSPYASKTGNRQTPPSLSWIAYQDIPVCVYIYTHTYRDIHI